MAPQSNHVKVDFASFYQKLNILKQEDIEKQDSKNNELNPDNRHQMTEFYDDLQRSKQINQNSSKEKTVSNFFIKFSNFS